MKVLLFFCFCMPEEAGIPVRISAERKTTMELLADLFGNVQNLTVPMVLMWIIGAVDVTKNLTFLTKIGWLGYTSYKLDADDAKASTDLGLDLSGENLQFSLVYNF